MKQTMTELVKIDAAMPLAEREIHVDNNDLFGIITRERFRKTLAKSDIPKRDNSVGSNQDTLQEGALCALVKPLKKCCGCVYLKFLMTVLTQVQNNFKFKTTSQ